MKNTIGRIKQIIFNNNNYYILKIEVTNQSENGVEDISFDTMITVKGISLIHLAVNDIVEFSYYKDKQVFNNITITKTASCVALRNILKNVNGINQGTINKIEHLSFGQLLNFSKHDFISECKLTDKKATLLEDRFKVVKNQILIAEELVELLQDIDKVNAIMRLRDLTTAQDIINHPFDFVKQISYSTALKIYLQNRVFTDAKNNYKELIKSLIIKILDLSVNLGNLYVTKDYLTAQIASVLKTTFNDKMSSNIIKSSKIVLSNCLEDLENEMIIYIENDRINNMSTYYSEAMLAGYVKKYASEAYTDEIQDCDINYLTFLNDDQKEAVYNSLTQKISILTGGPGTGKTQTVLGIVAAAEEQDLTVSLLAPTGKAARRMNDMTNMPARTIHAALQIFNQDEDEVVALDTDVVVIDESSMIDVWVFQKLLKACESVRNIVLVGDVNQIQSVGPGSIFKDIINSGLVKTVTLTKTYRQSGESSIISNAVKVLNGNTLLVMDNTFKCSKITTESISAFVDTIDTDKVQILCTSRLGDCGTIAINHYILQKLFNRDEIIVFGRNKAFAKGAKVVQIENNYQLNVMNGEIGTIIDINSCNILVDYNNKQVEYTTDCLSQLELAYAITIHKSQGSEWDNVCIVTGDFIGNNKNLLYTAITRAKKVVQIADVNGNLEKMIQTEQEIRNSNLNDLLK